MELYFFGSELKFISVIISDFIDGFVFETAVDIDVGVE